MAPNIATLKIGNPTCRRLIVSPSPQNFALVCLVGRDLGAPWRSKHETFDRADDDDETEQRHDGMAEHEYEGGVERLCRAHQISDDQRCCDTGSVAKGVENASSQSRYLTRRHIREHCPPKGRDSL